VAQLLPPESSAIDLVSREVGISVATLERWRAAALAHGSGACSPRWTAAARLQAVIVTATVDEATRSAWCREQGLYPTGLDGWKRDAIAGYGTGSRLDYLLVPLVFGLGAPMVALVGTNIGAGDRARALRIAMTGSAVVFLLCEAIGLAAAIWPHAWLGLFDDDPRMLETGVAYLRAVGPAYGFFGLGLALYFASQGAGRLFWPLLGGFIRLVLAVGGGWLTWHLTGSLD